MAKVYNANKQAQISKVAKLEQELALTKEQAAQLKNVAQESVTGLLFIESKLSPQLLRKVNFWNVLFHWKEVVAIIEEIILLIKKFRESSPS